MAQTRIAGTPVTLGRNGRTPKTLRNRLASAPMERNYGTPDGYITEQYIDYLVTRAKAGLGMVTTEATYVRADGKGRTHQLGLHTDDMIPGLRRLTEALHAEGALAAVELNHGGRTAQAAVSGFKNLAPSPVPCPTAGGEVPRELTAAECYELVAAYAAAARRAVAAGFDVINLHGAHGYLIHQFMSPISNHRTDEFAAPWFFMNLVIDAVREAVPDTIVGMRVSVVEGPADGISAEQQVAIIAKAHLDKLDFLDISAGSYDAGEWIVQSGEWKPGILADYAKAYRQFGLPLGMAGRLNSPEIIEEVLSQGTCDFVSLARAIHADPAFVGGVLRGERYRPCIACNVCIDNLGLGQVTCTVNPAVGRSRVPVPTPAVRPDSKVLVVGAGPAGLTAARELAEAGARVTLMDDGVRPGGQFAMAERMKSTPDFHRFAEWSSSENERLGVEVRLGACVDISDAGKLAREVGADAVVLATGGLRPTPGFIGADLPQVSDVRDWLSAHPDILDGDASAAVPEAVTIWGADSVAMTVADTLASLGTAVLIVGPQAALAPESGRRAKILAVPRLEANPQVRIFLSSTIEEYDGSRVRISRAGVEDQWVEAPGDLLVSRSVLPLDGSLTLEEREAGLSVAASVPVALAGTVVDTSPAMVSNAVKSGYDAAQRIASTLAGRGMGAEFAGTVPGRWSFPAKPQASGDFGAQQSERQPRRLGLAQLSLVGTAPPDLVSIAAQAGFDFIGARVRPVTASERPYDLQPGSPMLRETLARMADTGITVEDIEFLLLDGTGLQNGTDQRQAWLQMMEAGQALGASTLTVACADPDLDRFGDHLAQMTQDGKAYGIMPTLEPIAYQAVRSIPQAAALARRAGCRIVVDALHVNRFGGSLDQLEAAADLVPLIQLCDGPSSPPSTRDGLIMESRSERGVPGEGEFDLAALVAAFPADTPVSIETPSDRRVAALGESGWATHLKAAAGAVLSTLAIHNAALTGSNK
ncbi:FAD-dependent oxidoreductase [Paenarthrobacter sp. AR 02]|uniref:oxidoreductase n=1 Tax=Paenarthrobacter sp. AR 02 TaxID=2899821 RepID=UPI001F3F7448|nr:FAD-dependent oxidoreductase [Paenarthrobacter sp. AR 02]MCF3138175.1 FAD-dependent oxidoreductase [Paenarthrobacter sp. AR 02]